VLFAPILDILLIAVLLGYGAYGVSVGLTRSLFVIAGITAGIVAAVLVAPSIAAVIPVPQVRVAATFASTIGLIALGHTIAHTIAKALRDHEENSRLQGIDRVAGGIAVGLLAALVISTVGFSAPKLGSPLVSRTVAGSVVIRVIHDLTPPGVELQIAHLRNVLSDQGVTFFSSDLDGYNAATPTIDIGSARLATAAESVVRITGNAFACGQSQTGTGFIVANDRVVTNAHVVAGIEQPVVEALNGQVLTGTVVYFDASNDLAVIAVPGLAAAPLSLGIPMQTGDTAAIVGYPFGGPITVNAAIVRSVSTASSANIYGGGGFPRQVYTLAGKVSPGNSGGPLLTLDGDVIGAIFARGADQKDVGYAVTLTELQPVVNEAAALTTTVSSGTCIRD
jgi:S1-C subfamily serine protease